MVTDFWRIGENYGKPPSFLALASHNEWEDCNMDACINTADDLYTSGKNWVHFSPVTHEFCRRVAPGGLLAGLCHGSLVV